MFVQEHGTVYPVKDKDDQPTGIATWPQVKLMARIGEQLGRIEREFGLTPAARATLRVDVPPAPRKRRAGKDRFLSLPGETEGPG